MFHNTEYHVRMVAQSRRERMVAHDLARSVCSSSLTHHSSKTFASFPLVCLPLPFPLNLSLFGCELQQSLNQSPLFEVFLVLGHVILLMLLFACILALGSFLSFAFAFYWLCPLGRHAHVSKHHHRLDRRLALTEPDREMIGIHSAIWPPQSERVPPVQ